MSLRAYRTFQALILGGLGVFLFSRVMDGGILLYINQRLVILEFLAALALILMAQFILRERPTIPAEGVRTDSGEAWRQDSRKVWFLWLLALPLLVGLLVPEHPLHTGDIEERSLTTASSDIYANSAGVGGVKCREAPGFLDGQRVQVRGPLDISESSTAPEAVSVNPAPPPSQLDRFP